MSKRIVFCCDGTWQAPMSGTNVYRLYKALLVTSDQVTYYDDGVGADATGLSRILQGAFGQGLIQKITDAYTKIAHVYVPGDEIYLFGFSRGAYTARSLAGMIANCGLPTGAFTDNCVTQAFAAYRDPVQRAAILGSLVGSADAPDGMSCPGIAMIGAWDTVGALGIPAIFGGIDEKTYGFLDTGLHPDVKSAVHCMAIDEARPQFPATLWNEPSPANTGQTIEQVWFSGCHGDVGGGTVVGGPVDAGTRLCDITLGHMLARAQAAGLTFDPAIVAQYGNLPSTLPAKFALDLIRESWAPQDGPQHHRPIPAKANVANSVAIRIQYAQIYQPANLTINDGALADTYNMITAIDPTAL